MKKLAISIPNYNRVGELNALLSCLVEEIVADGLYDNVQICICDDCSEEDPTRIVERYLVEKPEIEICYQRNEENLGMSRNFLKVALMGEAEYCWIIGNDDVPEKGGVSTLLKYLERNAGIDFVITPFDVYSTGTFKGTVYPLDDSVERIYDTANESERINLFHKIEHNSAIFGFLSNVVFRKGIWEERKTKFTDKLDSLFIQMYINIDSLLQGARYGYLESKIIRNNLDDKTNNTLQRIAGVLFGLDDVVEYFFDGDDKKQFKKVLTDPFINGVLWDADKHSEYYEEIKKIRSEKNKVYEKYFIRTENRKDYFSDKTVMIYGAGDYGKRALEELRRVGAEVIGVADSDIEKHGLVFGDFTICSVKEMVDMCHEKSVVVVVANHHHLIQMVERVKEFGIEKIAVIT